MNKRLTSRRYHIVGQMEVDDAIQFDGRLADVLNWIKSESYSSNGMYAIFLRGVESFESERVLSGDLTTEQREVISIARMRAEIDRRNSRIKRLADLYQSMPKSEFIDWCESNSIDYDEFINDYDKMIVMGMSSKTEKIMAFLSDVLGDMEPHETKDVRAIAEAEGLVVNQEDWDFIRTVAHRFNFTGNKHGSWQKRIV